MNVSQNMNLVMSCFITHERYGNKLNRYDVFISTINSYSKLKFKNVYLFIMLDWDLKHKKNELEKICRTLLKYDDFKIVFKRLTTKEEWADFLQGKLENDCLWWFSQNDDHPLICSDLKYLTTLLNVLSCTTKPASIYLSHWPEMIAMVEKLKNEVEFQPTHFELNGTMLDSIQVFNSNMMKSIFFDFDWPVQAVNRIDTLAISQNFLENAPAQNPICQTILVPKMEICRKFMGYGHVNFEYDAGLTIIPSVYNPITDKTDLINYLTARHYSAWQRGYSETPNANILGEVLEVHNHLRGNESHQIESQPSLKFKLDVLLRKSYILANIKYKIKKAKFRVANFLRRDK